MSNELGMAFGDAIGGAMASFRNDRARQDMLNKDRALREHERNLEQVRQAIAQIESSSRERVAQTGAQSRGYVADVGNEGRHYAADLAAGSAEDRANATRYGADQGLAGRRYASDAAAKARGASDVNAATIAGGRNANALTVAGLRNKGTLAAALARPGRPAGGAGDAVAQRDLASARSLYGRMFGPRTPQIDAQGNTVPQAAPPKFEDWMQSGGAGRLPPSAAPAGPGGAQPGARRTFAPQHQQTAEQFKQKLLEAQASGDPAKVQAVKDEAKQFLSGIGAIGGAPPQPQDDNFDDGADDENDDDEDDQQP